MFRCVPLVPRKDRDPDHVCVSVRVRGREREERGERDPSLQEQLASRLSLAKQALDYHSSCLLLLSAARVPATACAGVCVFPNAATAARASRVRGRASEGEAAGEERRREEGRSAAAAASGGHTVITV